MEFEKLDQFLILLYFQLLSQQVLSILGCRFLLLRKILEESNEQISKQQMYGRAFARMDGHMDGHTDKHEFKRLAIKFFQSPTIQ